MTIYILTFAVPKKKTINIRALRTKERNKRFAGINRKKQNKDIIR